MENTSVWDVLKCVEEAEGATRGHLLTLGSEGLDAATAEAVANKWLWLDELEVYRMTDDGQSALDTERLG
ncbi:hypothetical protein DSM112329_03706 [Paraconexibacter sp. AEG42_29]|uniref:Uncharacterized protein n=1 Tax=Paraconexibacter sp. AEG42_29 TaxID=2997339 RepID=A0AAU7AZT8_9ACTN